MEDNAKLAGVRLRGPAPSLAESTKIAPLANTRNSIYKALRFEGKNPEVQMMLKDIRFQNGWRSGEVQVKPAEKHSSAFVLAIVIWV